MGKFYTGQVFLVLMADECTVKVTNKILYIKSALLIKVSLYAL